MDVNINDLTMRKDCTSWKWIRRFTIGTWNVEGNGHKELLASKLKIHKNCCHD